MGQITMALPPPLLWQQFETLTKDVAEHAFTNIGGFQNYGTQGSAQNGVDVFGDHNSKITGIQCKRLGKFNAQGQMLPGGLKIKHLNTEISLAEKFSSPLSHYIIATTDGRTTSLQDEALKINEKRKSLGKFTFQIWFWEDYLSYLHKYSPLLNWYYENILEQKGVYSTDHQILYLLHMAFSRPAFNTKLTAEESGNGLFVALKDTETAINTGQLKDRLDGSLIRIAPGGVGFLLNTDWRKKIEEALNLVKNARSEYKKAKDVGSISESTHRVFIRDFDVAIKIDDSRRKAIELVNEVLVSASLPQINSSL